MVFRLGSIPVRIHGSFFLTMAFFGMTGGRGPAQIATFVSVVFLSVLVHELGHALTGRLFGLVPAIDLHGMGGTTSWPQGKEVSSGRRVLISFAGPATGIAIGTLLLLQTNAGAELRGLAIPYGSSPGWSQEVIKDVIWVNVGWGIFNLLPMLPLDGGNIMVATLDAITGGRGEKPARIVSMVASGSVVLAAVLTRSYLTAIFAASFVVQNYRALQSRSLMLRDEPLRRALEEAVTAINLGYGHAAIEALQPIIEQAETPQLKAEAMRALAYAYEKKGSWDELVTLLGGSLNRMLPDEELQWFEAAAEKAGRLDMVERIRSLRSASVSPVGSDFNAGS